MSIYKVIDLQLYQQSIKIQNILKCPKHETKLTRNTLTLIPQHYNLTLLISS